MRYCFVDNVFNPCHVLDYFTQYSGLNCHELRKQVLDLVKADRDHWVHVVSIVLPLRPQNFDEWLVSMEDPTTACDKFFLFILSRMYYWHTIVYMIKRSWTTLCVYGYMSEEEVHAACDLHLIYLGQDVYGQLVLTIMPSTHTTLTSVTPSNAPIKPIVLTNKQEKYKQSCPPPNISTTSVVPTL